MGFLLDILSFPHLETHNLLLENYLAILSIWRVLLLEIHFQVHFIINKNYKFYLNNSSLPKSKYKVWFCAQSFI